MYGRGSSPHGEKAEKKEKKRSKHKDKEKSRKKKKRKHESSESEVCEMSIITFNRWKMGFSPSRP